MKDPAASTIIIDASNVCRDSNLAPRGVPASWRRLSSLLGALDQSAIAFADVYVVADRTLHFAIDAEGQRALRQLERAKRAEQVRFADERIVELAFGSTSPLQGALIATQDEFDDFRRSYPEIEHTPGRAVRWHADGQGKPVPHRCDFSRRTHQRMSRKEEEGELAQRRLRRQDAQERAVATYFRCLNVRSCLVAQLWPERLEELPMYDERRDRFVCPSCQSDLEVGERRAPAVQLIVLLDEIERARLLLEEGSSLQVGRVDARGCIGLERHLPKERVGTLSRRHVRFDLRGTEVLATDLNSKNGTWISPRRDRTSVRQLSSERPEKWALRDALVLPGGITFERSGRRHPLVGQRASDKAATHPEVEATRLFKRNPP